MELKNEVQDLQLNLSSKQYGGHDVFKGLFLPGSGPGQRGVILMHGRNAHPDGVVVGLMRKSLRQLGYATLSIQNPIPKDGDEFPNYVSDIKGENYLFPEAFARIDASLAELKTRGIKETVLLGFSMGARLLAAYLAQGRASALPIKGLAVLSGGINGVGPLNIATSLERVQLPALDICGQGDADVASTAEARKTGYESGKGTKYFQVILQGAVPHNFAGHEKELVEKVHSWITSVAPA